MSPREDGRVAKSDRIIASWVNAAEASVDPTVLNAKGS